MKQVVMGTDIRL